MLDNNVEVSSVVILRSFSLLSLHNMFTANMFMRFALVNEGQRVESASTHTDAIY